MEALTVLLFIACMVLVAVHIDALRTHKRELVSAKADAARAEAANELLRRKLADLVSYCTGGRLGDASYSLPQMVEAIEHHYRQHALGQGAPLELSAKTNG